MRAGESKEYLASIQAEITAEPHAQLRAWYETESALQPQYQEAEQLQSALGNLASGLSRLIEDRKIEPQVDKESATDTETSETTIDFDEYLTPLERKQKSVYKWVDELTQNYTADIQAARGQTKKSKREKQEHISRKRFIRSFESYGEEEMHVLHDADALAFTFDKLDESYPGLAKALEANCTEYLHKNGIEYAEDTRAFADLIAQSLEEAPQQMRFDAFVSAVFDKKYFVQKPMNAVRLHVALARAALDERHVTNPAYLQQVVSTAYLHNDTIQDKEGFVTAWTGYATVASGLEDPQIFLDSANARQVFYQAAYAVSKDPKRMAGHRDAHINQQLGVEVLKQARIDFGSSALDQASAAYKFTEIKEFRDNPQYFDGLEIIDIENGEIYMPHKSPQDAPLKYKNYFESDLYTKRAALFMPRALAVDAIYSYANSEQPRPVSPVIFHSPIAAGLNISYTAFDMEHKKDGVMRNATNESFNHFFTYLLENHDEMLRPELVEPSENAALRNGLFVDTVELDGKKTYVIAILRPQVPVDFYHVNPHEALKMPLGKQTLEDAQSIGYESLDKSNEELLERIRENGHNFPGRRPVLFDMPAKYKSRGLEAISMRVHENRQLLVVTTHQTGGDVEMIMTRDMQLARHAYDFNKEGQPNLVTARFRNILLSLYEQWACRPVIETSEGIVSSEDKKSKVNLGFLRYLPEGGNFSDKQTKVFKLEQQGDLARESLHRKPLDPTGLGRNSTYVRETYDPGKPPLEIYYDQSVLGE